MKQPAKFILSTGSREPIEPEFADRRFQVVEQDETPEERRRRLARERKQRQRERETAFDMRVFHLPLAAVQRDDLRRAATAAGFYDQREYLVHLINSDLTRLGLKRCRPADLKERDQ